MGYDDWKLIIGKKIKQPFYYDQYVLLEMEDGGIYQLEPEGDCCAHCFFQHINYPDALIGGTIAKVVNVEQDRLKDTDYEVVDVWAHKLITDKGVCMLEMRLEHNGYYGGRMNVRKYPSPVPADAKPLEEF